MGKKGSLSNRISGRSGRRFFNFTYSFGAAIVIVGAMFKIMHWPYANWILGIAMTVEALVFLLAAFDPSMSEDDDHSDGSPNAGQDANFNSQPSSVQISKTSYPSGKASSVNVEESTQSAATTSPVTTTGSGGGSSTVVVLGGGGTSSTQVKPSDIPTGQAVQGNQPIVVGGGGYTASNKGKSEQVENLQSTSEPNNFDSVTEISNNITATQPTQGYANNMDVLNNNLVELNDVYESQLKSIREQIDTMKQTNDSLDRIKRLYDGAVGDGYTFRDESEKLTKNIEALNRVYERLLHAMTTNNSYDRRDRERDDRDSRDRY